MFGDLKERVNSLMTFCDSLQNNFNEFKYELNDNHLMTKIYKTFEMCMDNSSDGSNTISSTYGSSGIPIYISKPPSSGFDPDYKLKNKFIKLLDTLISEYIKKYLKENITNLIEQEWFIDTVVDKINKKQLKQKN